MVEKAEVAIGKRDAAFCNIKVLLLYLVVYGHLIEARIQDSAVLLWQYRAIYAVHMPLFAFLSGMFLKGEERCLAQMKKAAAYYVCLQAAAMVPAWIGGGSFSLAVPVWHLWYLLSLCCWAGMGLLLSFLEKRFVFIRDVWIKKRNPYFGDGARKAGRSPRAGGEVRDGKAGRGPGAGGEVRDGKAGRSPRAGGEVRDGKAGRSPGAKGEVRDGKIGRSSGDSGKAGGGKAESDSGGGYRGKALVMIACVMMACAAGNVQAIDRTFSLSRTIVFWPYVLAGREFPRDIRRKRYRIPAVLGGILALALLAAVGERMPVELLYQADSYLALGLEDGFWLRLASYIIGAGLGALLLIFMPERRLTVSKVGADTLWIYVLHAPLVALIRNVSLEPLEFLVMAPFAALAVVALLYEAGRWKGRLYRIV